MILSTEKLDKPGIVVVVRAHNSSNQEASTGGSQIWGQPGLHSELQDHPDQLMRSCLKTMLDTFHYATSKEITHTCNS